MLWTAEEVSGTIRREGSRRRGPQDSGLPPGQGFGALFKDFVFTLNEIETNVGGWSEERHFLKFKGSWFCGESTLGR